MMHCSSPMGSCYCIVDKSSVCLTDRKLLFVFVSLIGLVYCVFAAMEPKRADLRALEVDFHETPVLIFVKPLQGNDIIAIDIKLSASVAALQEIVQEKTGTPPADQHLCYQGKPLHSDDCLQYYALQKEATVRMTGKLRGGGKGAFSTKKNKMKHHSDDDGYRPSEVDGCSEDDLGTAAKSFAPPKAANRPAQSSDSVAADTEMIEQVPLFEDQISELQKRVEVLEGTVQRQAMLIQLASKIDSIALRQARLEEQWKKSLSSSSTGAPVQEASKQAVDDDDRLVAEQLGRQLIDLCPEQDAHERCKIALHQARLDDMDKPG